MAAVESPAVEALVGTSTLMVQPDVGFNVDLGLMDNDFPLIELHPPAAAILHTLIRRYSTST